MLFAADAWPGIADGSITLTFRAWKRPQAREGARHHTPAGDIIIESIALVPAAEIPDTDAQRAGFSSRAALLARLGTAPPAEVYRVSFRYAGSDPRLALRNQAALSDAEFAALRARLDRLDRAGAWIRPTLEAIRERPGAVSTELAAALGRDRLPFKEDVRKLKALGLTESLAVGYRLTPRGLAVLGRLRTGDG